MVELRVPSVPSERANYRQAIGTRQIWRRGASSTLVSDIVVV
jgi:hypothetical protein